MEKRYVLCFGDSNTWGVDPKTGGQFAPSARLPEEVRWSGVAQKELGEDYRLLVDGCNGRTVCHDDPIEGDRNGRKHLPRLLWSHMPLDLVVIMLGTNDLKPRFCPNLVDISAGLKTLILETKKSECGKNGTAPQILIVSPIHVRTDMPEKWLGGIFGGYGPAAQLSYGFAEAYKTVAENTGCHFMDAAQFARPSADDGIHIEVADHDPLGKAVAEKIRAILGQGA